ncbi:MAG: hypothetical protein ACLFP6_01790 [Spirochaetaceae bacterium]
MAALSVQGLTARDWYEPMEIINPLLFRSYQGTQILPGGYAETIYSNQALLDGRYDSFQINGRAGHTLVASPRFALSLSYGTYLMNGPVNEGGTPGSRLQWLMNAVQFEYGFFAAWDAGPLYLLAEYGRTSQHPFRRDFSEVSSDLVKIGFAPHPFHIGPVELRALLRLGYSDIFDFWESRLEDPRTRWMAQPAVRAHWPGFELDELMRVGLFFEGDGELGIARSARFEEEGDFVGNIALKGGVRLRGIVPDGLSPGSIDLYLDYYGSDNSEIRDDRKTPVQLLGYAVRFRLFY